MNKSQLGKQSRVKGHTFERELVKILREVGFDCSTSRYSSRELDDKCIDIVINAPLAIQCKATNNNFPNPVKELDKIQTDNDHKVLAVKLKNRGVYITMELKGWIDLLKILKSNKLI